MMFVLGVSGPSRKRERSAGAEQCHEKKRQKADDATVRAACAWVRVALAAEAHMLQGRGHPCAHPARESAR